MSCGTCLFADRGGRESFGLAVPEERAQFNRDAEHGSLVRNATIEIPPERVPFTGATRTYGQTHSHQRTSGRNRILV